MRSRLPRGILESLEQEAAFGLVIVDRRRGAATHVSVIRHDPRSEPLGPRQERELLTLARDHLAGRLERETAILRRAAEPAPEPEPVDGGGGEA